MGNVQVHLGMILMAFAVLLWSLLACFKGLPGSMVWQQVLLLGWTRLSSLPICMTGSRGIYVTTELWFLVMYGCYGLGETRMFFKYITTRFLLENNINYILK